MIGSFHRLRPVLTLLGGSLSPDIRVAALVALHVSWLAMVGAGAVLGVVI